MNGTDQITSLIQTQREFFASGQTRGLTFRRDALKRLKDAIKSHEDQILNALMRDLGKPAFEGFVGEIAFVYEEINYTLKNLAKWTKPKYVSTPWQLEWSKSVIITEPKGVVLIIGPWNYPFNLIMSPLVGAIAAGNCVVVKPSEIATNTEKVITDLIAKLFPKEFCAVINGGVEATSDLLKQKFDHIFFTGSTAVGRVVMRAAAEHLTPVTLELGGKSPCIIDQDIDLAVTARRVMWGKFYNAGQTCVAPDYLLVHKSIKSQFLQEITKTVQSFFGPDPKQSTDFGRIINEHHFDRLTKYLEEGEAVIGGQSDRADRYIAPTVLEQVHLNSGLMNEEIFGPILPMLEFENIEEVFSIIKARSRPLALYLFTRDKTLQDRVLEELSFGGGCINNALLHLANPQLPFGGIGDSGIGAYHGRHSFECFSHAKSVLKSSFWADFKFKYPPYGARMFRLVKRILG
jgi:aldehyde dehydrogenase (NAD+)